MKFCWQITILAFFISCNRPYNPNGFEKLILKNESSNYKFILQFDDEKFHKIREGVWDEIEYYGNKPKDVELGRSIDSVFVPTLRCLKLIDICIEKIGQNKNGQITISEFKNLYNTAIRIKSRYNFNFWNTVIDKRKLSNDPTEFEDVFKQLFEGHNHIEILTQLKFSFYTVYINILEDFSQEVGSTNCWMGPIIAPRIILSPKNADINTFYDGEVYMIDYHIFHGVSKRKYFYNEKKLSMNRGDGLISIPITDTALGEKSFKIISSFNYFGREFKSTTTGHYFVVKK